MVRGPAPAFTRRTFSCTAKGPPKVLRCHTLSSLTQGRLFTGLLPPVMDLLAFINMPPKERKRERKGPVGPTEMPGGTGLRVGRSHTVSAHLT